MTKKTREKYNKFIKKSNTKQKYNEIQIHALARFMLDFIRLFSFYKTNLFLQVLSKFACT